MTSFGGLDDGKEELPLTGVLVALHHDPASHRDVQPRAFPNSLLRRVTHRNRKYGLVLAAGDDVLAPINQANAAVGQRLPVDLGGRGVGRGGGRRGRVSFTRRGKKREIACPWEKIKGVICPPHPALCQELVGRVRRIRQVGDRLVHRKAQLLRPQPKHRELEVGPPRIAGGGGDFVYVVGEDRVQAKKRGVLPVNLGLELAEGVLPRGPGLAAGGDGGGQLVEGNGCGHGEHLVVVENDKIGFWDLRKACPEIAKDFAPPAKYGNKKLKRNARKGLYTVDFQDGRHSCAIPSGHSFLSGMQQRPISRGQNQRRLPRQACLVLSLRTLPRERRRAVSPCPTKPEQLFAALFFQLTHGALAPPAGGRGLGSTASTARRAPRRRLTPPSPGGSPCTLQPDRGGFQ